ncbi:MAG: hypothetical protein QM778_17020 [Myxococcales bacterium]
MVGVSPVGPVRPAFWNAWWSPADEDDGDPLSCVDANTRVQLNLNLASHFRSKVSPGRAAGGKLQTALEEAAARGSRRVRLQVVPISNERYLRVLDDTRTMTIDLDSMRESAGPLGGAYTEFSRVTFRTDVIAAGKTEVGFSIWHDGKPIDEVHAYVTVRKKTTETCPPIALDQRAHTLDELASAGAARASIHLVQLDDQSSMGVFRQADWPTTKFITWQLQDNVSFAKYVEGTIADALSSALKQEGEAELKSVGEDLKLALFGSNQEIRDAFEALVAAQGASKKAEVLYVRSVLKHEGPDWLPLGFIPVDNEAAFLGFLFRIEMPLRGQSNELPASCLSRWVLAYPSTDGDGASSKAWDVIKEVVPWKGLASTFSNVGAVRDWLRDNKAEPENVVVTLLGHHKPGMFSYRDDGSRFVLASSVQRELGPSSVVILNGCSTGTVRSDFVTRFASHGASAAIVTANEVSPHLAGTFLRCLAEATAAQPGATLLNLQFAAASCVSKADIPFAGRKYGARALTFSLLGNGSIPLCLPEAPRETHSSVGSDTLAPSPVFQDSSAGPTSSAADHRH